MKCLCTALFCFLIFTARSQNGSPDSTLRSAPEASMLRVRSITLNGNKKTKPHIILREMQFKEGDAIAATRLQQEIEIAREFIYNTTLFVSVEVTPQFVGDHEVDVWVEVKERWYIFPIPYFELGDRSFNEWVKTYHADLNRVGYGVKFRHFNFSGRKDQLAVTLINGFRRNLSFEYSAPYLNAAMTDGIRVGAGYFQTRQIPYQTGYENNLMYFKNDHFVKSEWYALAGYSRRKSLRKKELFTLTFHHIAVDDSIVPFKNPNYFNHRSSTQNFIELDYKLNYANVDNVMYPLRGYTCSLMVKKTGLQWDGGMNQLSIYGNFKRYFSHPHQWYTSIRLAGEVKLPFAQSYYNQKALGYEEDYLRGDEYFVIDGVMYGYAKLDLKKRLFGFKIPTYLKSKTYDHIPFTFYAKTFADAGYVYCQPRFDTRLNNRFLYSGGFGLDIVTLYDIRIGVEYSMNQLGQKGVFLHR